MAKQATVYMTTDSAQGSVYYFWSKKPRLIRKSFYSGLSSNSACKRIINRLIPPAKLNKRGMKKLTIKIEDIE